MTPNNQKVIDGQPAPTSPGLSFLPGTIFTARKKRRRENPHPGKGLVSFNEGRVLAHPNSGSSVQGTCWHFAIPPFATLVVDHDPDAAWARLLVLSSTAALHQNSSCRASRSRARAKGGPPAMRFWLPKRTSCTGDRIFPLLCVLSFNRDPTVPTA